MIKEPVSRRFTPFCERPSSSWRGKRNRPFSFRT